MKEAYTGLLVILHLPQSRNACDDVEWQLTRFQRVRRIEYESVYRISMLLFLSIYSSINICQHKFAIFSFLQVNCIHC